MDLELRIIRENEFDEYVRTMFWAAGRTIDRDFIEERRRCTEFDHALAAFEDGKLVGTLGTRYVEMHLPSKDVISVGAIGQAGVLPGRTGRGHMRKMVTRALADARERGTAICAWTTSAWSMHERYGSGPATYAANYEVDISHARWRQNLFAEGDCELVSAAFALRHLSDLHAISANNGYTLVPRNAEYWSVITERLSRGDSLDYLDPPGQHPPPFFCLYRNRSGETEGLAIYRVYNDWERGLPTTVLELLFTIVVNNEALFGLYRQIFSTPLVAKIRMPHRPLDEPLRWMLVDGRHLKNTYFGDHVWLRIVDLPEAFRLRGSGSFSGSLTIRITDDIFDKGGTVLRLTADAEALYVETTSDEPEIEADISVISSLFLGGSDLRPFIAANRLKYAGEAALIKVSNLFQFTFPPFIDTDF